MSLVSIREVRKSFGPLEVLKGVSLEVEKGDVVAIIGRSGSGKSTLLRCINGLETYQGGAILADGIEVGGEKRELARTAPSRRHGVPAVQPVPAFDRGGKRHAGADDRQQDGEKRGARFGRGNAGQGRAVGEDGVPIRASCPAASSSASRSPARSPCGPRCCCATRSPRRSIRSWSTRSCAWSSSSRARA